MSLYIYTCHQNQRPQNRLKNHIDFCSYSKCPRTYTRASKIGTLKIGQKKSHRFLLLFKISSCIYMCQQIEPSKSAKKITSIFAPIQNYLIHIHVPAKYIGNVISWDPSSPLASRCSAEGLLDISICIATFQ